MFGTLMLQVHFTLLVLVQDYKKGQVWIVQGKHFGNLFYFLFHFMNCCIFCLFLDIIGIEHEHGFIWCVLAWKMAITLIIINQFVLVWICVLYVHMFCFHVFVLYIYIYISVNPVHNAPRRSPHPVLRISHSGSKRWWTLLGIEISCSQWKA